MWQQSHPARIAARRLAGARGCGVAVSLGIIVGLAPSASASWGALPQLGPPPGPPDQSWLIDAPEKPGARSKGKVAVFAFKGDDVYQPVRAAVVRVLRRRRLNVTLSLRPVDSAREYREMSQASNLAVYVSGELEGEGARQRALIHLHSGVSGGRMASLRFAGPTREIVADVERTFWTRVGPAIQRVCASMSRPRRREREPLLIDAGDPRESKASEPQGP